MLDDLSRSPLMPHYVSETLPLGGAGLAEGERGRSMLDHMRLSRRRFIGVAAGSAGALALAGWSPKARADDDDDDDDRLLRKRNIGIILFSVRDAVSRDPTTTELPSGFREVFERMAKIGYEQIEFAGYGQNANAAGGANPGASNPGAYLAFARTLRGFLDEFGLEANGTHAFIPGSLTQANLDRYRLELEFAATLGMGYYGTGGDPSGSRFTADWDAAAERWNQLGEIARDEYGIRLYTHNHDAVYNFLLDSGPLDALGRPTRSSGLRMLEYGFTVLDPRYVFFEMDIFWAHVAQHRFQTYTASDGSTQTDVFDPAGTVRAEERRSRTLRFPLFHAKDGRRTADPPGVGSGYTMVPFGQGDIDFATFFDRIGRSGRRIPFWEQDNAPGGAANPGQSLAFAEVSYAPLRDLRAGDDDDDDDDDD
jgi:sugar phosphate isomerase/epimerase